MEEKEEARAYLGRMSTEWDLVFRAHRGPPESMAEAQEILIRRYAGAVHRYLLGAVRDPDVAAELSQEFALRFLRGDFHWADPARGRFRDFVKQALHNQSIELLLKAPTPTVEVGVVAQLAVGLLDDHERGDGDDADGN